MSINESDILGQIIAEFEQLFPETKNVIALAEKYGREALLNSNGRIKAACQCARTMALVAEASGPIGGCGSSGNCSSSDRVINILDAFNKGFQSENLSRQ